MSGITPLNTYQIFSNPKNPSLKGENSAPKKSYDLLYEDLASKANEVSPNEAKARIVKNSPVGTITTPIKDTLQDVSNCKKAIAHGRISDNNLGRLNDLGLKFGALAIASFLAMKARTTTNAIMQFVGGGAFIASMSLWPKLFINLPARIIHGFPIDQKYISAQGDKKEFFLDNQFIPWDAMKEEDKRKYAQKANIDYDGKNGKEKIERKMQKTALQNRTLGLFTASVGVPLMTSLVCNRIEPIIYNKVVDYKYNDAKNAINDNMENFFKLIKSEPRNEAEINNLIEQYAGKKLDDNFYQKLVNLLKIDDVLDELKDGDDTVPLNKYDSNCLIENLKKIQKANETIDTKEFIEKMTELAENKNAVKRIARIQSAKKINSKAILSEIQEAIENKTVTTQEEIISLTAERFKGILTKEQIGKVVESVELKDNTNFFEFIKEFNTTTVGQMRARLNKYLELVNTTLGSKYESVYTREYNEIMDKLFKTMNIPYDSVDGISLKGLSKKETQTCIDMLSQNFRDRIGKVEYGTDQYKRILEEFNFKFRDNRLKDYVRMLQSEHNLGSITGDIINPENLTGDFSSLTDALAGGKSGEGNIVNLIQNFIRRKEIDLDGVKTHPIICLNFENRVASGVFKNSLINNGLIDSNNAKEYEEFLNAARELLYSGNFSKRLCYGSIFKNDNVCKLLHSIIYDEKYFEYECKSINGFHDVLKRIAEIKDFPQSNPKDEYAAAINFARGMKEHAKKSFNDKSWMKIFAPIAIIVAAGTLLIQPFFGNIKKEFPQENSEKKGGNK